MIEYIKKSEALQAKKRILNPCIIKETSEQTEYARAYNKGWNDCNSEFIDNIERIAPTADVQEVKHGKWIKEWRDGFSNGKRNYELICPYCNFSYFDNHVGLIVPEHFNFCPNCGAKMDGEEE